MTQTTERALARNGATEIAARVRYAPTDLSTADLGRVLAQSGYFQDARDAAQAIVKVLYGRELGIGPVTAMLSVHIIQGKPAPSAGLLASLIKRSGSYTYRVRELDDDACAIEFLERSGTGWASLGLSKFTRADAEKAGALSGKNAHTWRSFPRNMLFARALSNGARWFCADIFGGPVYTPEEMDAPVDENGDVAEVRPARMPTATYPAPSRTHEQPGPEPAPDATRVCALCKAETDCMADRDEWICRDREACAQRRLADAEPELPDAPMSPDLTAALRPAKEGGEEFTCPDCRQTFGAVRTSTGVLPARDWLTFAATQGIERALCPACARAAVRKARAA